MNVQKWLNSAQIDLSVVSKFPQTISRLLGVNYGIANTVVLEIPQLTTEPAICIYA